MVIPANGQNPYFPYVYQPQPQQQPIQQTVPQTQSQNLVVNVPSIADAENYPVAPGLGVVLKINNSPYILCKSMGYSQFDAPKLKWYKLLEEEPKKDEETKVDEINELRSQISELKSMIENLATPNKQPVKKNAKEIDNA
ncbi:MAG: hypothetical protein J6Y02_16480 [Pseudobutyrivibrio sp.]|nr:hypothetical protein [Pseudobutyrivibrio sp.]